MLLIGNHREVDKKSISLGVYTIQHQRPFVKYLMQNCSLYAKNLSEIQDARYTRSPLALYGGRCQRARKAFGGFLRGLCGSEVLSDITLSISWQKLRRVYVSALKICVKMLESPRAGKY